MLNVQNMTGYSKMKKSPILCRNEKILITKFVTNLNSLIGMYCQNPIYPIFIRMFYNDNYIISQSLFSPLPDVVESKKDQNWKILSRKNCFTAEIEAAVILRPPFKDKLQRKQTREHCQWNNKPKNCGFYQSYWNSYIKF